MSIIGLSYEVCWQWHLFMMLQLVKPYPDSELHFIDMFQNMKRGSATWRLRDQTSKLRILSPPIMLTIKHERNPMKKLTTIAFHPSYKRYFCKNFIPFSILENFYCPMKINVRLHWNQIKKTSKHIMKLQFENTNSSFITLFMARQKELFASLNVSKSRTILDEVQ